MCSPLKPTANLLKFFIIIGGFPLIPQDETWTKFKFWNKAKFPHLFTYGLPIGLYIYSLIVIFGTTEHSFQDFKSQWYTHGLNLVDLTAVIVLIWTHIIIALVILVVFRNAADPISGLCQTMAEHNQLLGISEQDLRPLTKRTYLALLVLFILHIMSVVSSFRYCNDLLAKGLDTYLHFPMHIIWISIVFIFFWPFPVASSFIVNRQCLLTLDHQLLIYNSKIPLEEKDFEKRVSEQLNKEESTKIKIEDENGPEFYIDVGYKIRTSLDVANGTLGSFLFIDICMCVFVTIISVYFTPLIFEAFSHSEENSEIIINRIKLSYGLHCLFLAIKASVRWINFYRVGQNIAVKCHQISISLEHLLINHPKLTKEVRRNLKILIQRYKTNSPIRPWNSFDLNLSTAISAAGLVATYLVILIQFRQQSSSQESTSF